MLSKYVSQWEYTYTASKSQKLDRTELLHIANEMYDVCSVHSARQFAGGWTAYLVNTIHQAVSRRYINGGGGL